MLVGPRGGFKQGARLPLTLVFERAGRIAGTIDDKESEAIGLSKLRLQLAARRTSSWAHHHGHMIMSA